MLGHASALAIQVTPPQFPVLGSSLPVAILFLLHITVAEYSVGAITLGSAMEWRALRSGDPRALRYSRAVVNSYYLVFSLGATLAVFAVALLFGLWGNEIGQLFNVLLPLVAFAFGLFLVLAPLLVVYRNSTDRISAKAHAVLGTVVAALQTLFVFLIVGLDAYLITPFNSGLLATTLNPPYWPLLIHRLIGNVSWTALFLAAYAAFRLRSARTDEDRAFQGWAARVNLRIGLATALLMPVEGFFLVLVLQGAQPGYFENLVAGPNAWLMVLQEAFVAIVLVGGNVALMAESRWSGEQPHAIARPAIALSLAGMVVATLPSAVLPASLEVLRFVGLAVAVAVTAVHLTVRTLPQRTEPAPSAGSSMGAARGALLLVGAFSVLTSLLMGVIKEGARGDFGVYGELTQAQAQQPFQPPGSLYP
jgi:cytochrome bd-type quinol oxidase subunit 1